MISIVLLFNIRETNPVANYIISHIEEESVSFKILFHIANYGFIETLLVLGFFLIWKYGWKEIDFLVDKNREKRYEKKEELKGTKEKYVIGKSIKKFSYKDIFQKDRSIKFSKFYFHRLELEEKMTKYINNKENFIIYGQTMSGKNRIVYEVLRTLDKNKYIVTLVSQESF